MSLRIQRVFSLTDAEAEKVEKQSQALLMRAAVCAAFHPLAHMKVLIQLGYEPFPLTSGKLYWLFREAYYLPNGLSYTMKLYERCGLGMLFSGVQASALSHLTLGMVSLASTIYIDRHFSEIGGKPLNIDKDETELNDADSFRRTIRMAIRETITRSVGIIVARPFVVIMVRQVAQVIGGEMKYQNVWQSLRLIGIEEGPKGLFSGLVPQIIAETVSLWGVCMTMYGIERVMMRAQQNAKENGNKDDEAVTIHARKMLHLVAPILVNSIAYPFQVLSTVMAVAGSGLAVSMLPYSPPFGMWHDAFDYLKPVRGLQRGSRMFWREHLGAVSVGKDQQLYAANKHFL